MNIVAMGTAGMDRVFTVRIQLPMKEMAKHGHEVTFATEIAGAVQSLPGADLLVMARPGDIESVMLIQLAQSKGIKVVVDMDDAIHAVPVRNPFYVVWGTDIEIISQWQNIIQDDPRYLPTLSWVTKIDATTISRIAAGRLRSLEQCLSLADLVTFSVGYLKSYYDSKDLPIRRADILRNCISDEEWQGLERVERNDGQVSIRWGGSPTHHDDLELIIDPLETVLKKNPRVVFDTCGLSASGNAMFRHLQKDRYTSHEARPYQDYIAWLAHADIILCPSDYSVFSKGKSDLRAIQAGYLGIPVVGSACTYGSTISQARMGLVVQQRKHWAKQILKLAGSERMRMAAGRSGQDYVRTERVYSVGWKQWEQAYNGIL